MKNECYINGLFYTREMLQSQTREKLRELMRMVHTERASDVSRTWLGAQANTSELIEFILNNKGPQASAWQHRDEPQPVRVVSPLELTAPEHPIMELLRSNQPNAVPAIMPNPFVQSTQPQSSDLASVIAAAVQQHLSIPSQQMDGECIAALVDEKINNRMVEIDGMTRGAIDETVSTRILEATETLASVCKDKLDEQNSKIDFALSQIESAPRPIIIKAPEGDVEVTGLRHKAFDDLLADVVAFRTMGQTERANFWLVGPAGTGKTTAASAIAKALGLKFYTNGAIDSEYKLRGFIDAQGRIISTAFKKCYLDGGIYLFDEVDSSLPPALLGFNGALANGHYDFPGHDDPVPRHDNCIVLAASNTWGGPSGGYVGRYRQDAAFLDRFMHVPWETDEGLELSLCRNKKWAKYVQLLRKRVIDNGIEHIISPRATLNGDVLLSAGRPVDRVIDTCIRKGLSDEDWNGKVYMFPGDL